MNQEQNNFNSNNFIQNNLNPQSNVEISNGMLSQSNQNLQSTQTNHHTINNNIAAVDKQKNNKKLIIGMFIIAAIILVASLLVMFFLSKEEKDQKDVEKKYISLNMPLPADLLLEENYIKSQIYTFIYDSNKIVRRIIFTNEYYTEKGAESDYKSYLKNNNYDNYWNMPKKILKRKKNIVTFEYNDDIVEKYYDEFIGASIDDIIDEWGEDKILKNFVPDVDKDELEFNIENGSNNNTSSDENSQTKYELMARAAEKKFSESFTPNFNTAFNINYKYDVTIDENNIQYTDEYSDGDYYYVMTATVRNTSTNLSVGKFLVRCKWDENTKTIIEYGDNSRMVILSNVYGEAMSKVSEGSGVFYISKEQYKNDIMWETTLLEKNTFNTILNNVDKLTYYYYEFVYEKNESYLETMKTTQINYIKKILKNKEIDVHIVQIVTDNAINGSLLLEDYINYDLYIAVDENIKELIEYSKNLGLYYQETLYLNS